MIVKCPKCNKYFDDEFRYLLCPHSAFAANDGNNNFKVHNDAYLSDNPPNTVDVEAINDELKTYNYLDDLQKISPLENSIDAWAEYMLPSGNVETEVDTLLQMEAEEEKELNKEPS